MGDRVVADRFGRVRWADVFAAAGGPALRRRPARLRQYGFARQLIAALSAEALVLLDLVRRAG